MKQSILKIAALLFLFPGMALAHTGTSDSVGLMHGLGHPLGGADHLLAMLAVGLWAAQMGGRALWVVPSTFVAVTIIGGSLGFSGVALPFIEEGILLSVLVLGLLVAGAFRLPLLYGALTVSLFALFHGYAHGVEMPLAMGAASYTLGFALATAMLHLCGVGLGVYFQKADWHNVNRFAGGAIALAGVYLSLS